MHLVLINDYYVPLLGGAEVTYKLLLTELSKERYNRVSVIQLSNGKSENSPNKPFEMLELSEDNINIYITNGSYEVAAQLISRLNPDVIMTSGFATPMAVAVAHNFNVPVWVYVQSICHFCADPPSIAHCNKECSNCNIFKGNQERVTLQVKAVSVANKITTISHYLKREIEYFTGRKDVDILRPAVELKKYQIKTQGNKIIMSTGTKYKGVETFISLSKLYPNREFWVVGNYDPAVGGYDFTKLDNVKYTGWIKPEEIYSNCKYMLIPTVGPEGFSRVAIEAMANNIIPIGTTLGGAIDAIGNGGLLIDDHLNPNAWKNAIDMLDNDIHIQETLKSNMPIEIMKADHLIVIKQFKKMLNNLLVASKSMQQCLTA